MFLLFDIIVVVADFVLFFVGSFIRSSIRCSSIILSSCHDYSFLRLWHTHTHTICLLYALCESLYVQNKNQMWSTRFSDKHFFLFCLESVCVYRLHFKLFLALWQSEFQCSSGAAALLSTLFLANQKTSRCERVLSFQLIPFITIRNSGHHLHSNGFILNIRLFYYHPLIISTSHFSPSDRAYFIYFCIDFPFAGRLFFNAQQIVIVFVVVVAVVIAITVFKTHLKSYVSLIATLILIIVFEFSTLISNVIRRERESGESTARIEITNSSARGGESPWNFSLE